MSPEVSLQLLPWTWGNTCPEDGGPIWNTMRCMVCDRKAAFSPINWIRRVLIRMQVDREAEEE